jgi:hypothetical protein
LLDAGQITSGVHCFDIAIECPGASADTVKLNAACTEYDLIGIGKSTFSTGEIWFASVTFNAVS